MNRIEEITKELLNKMGVSFEEVSLSKKDSSEKEEWYQIKTSEQGIFLNKDAEALESLNHLVKRLVENKENRNNQNIKEEISLVLDIGEYKRKKIEKLRETAHIMAERAMFFKSSVEFEPMNSYERRILHVFLENHKELKTESIGFGRDRRVVVRYLGQGNI